MISGLTCHRGGVEVTFTGVCRTEGRTPMNVAYVAVRDFASLLPLRLQMNDLLRREKYGRLPRSLTAGGEPRSSCEVRRHGRRHHRGCRLRPGRRQPGPSTNGRVRHVPAALRT
ncbi:cyclophilin-like fold protein [Streptomyces pseudovenezuelae]|uniref:cyclophilin-like fold protein n=1 Tax=Streptomyces pseudovenezuelae TaxID=67350 RepID=UPI0039A4ED6D